MRFNNSTCCLTALLYAVFTYNKTPSPCPSPQHHVPQRSDCGATSWSHSYTSLPETQKIGSVDSS